MMRNAAGLQQRPAGQRLDRRSLVRIWYQSYVDYENGKTYWDLAHPKGL
jgi:hypothetical protein